ncbi:MAG TPA: hypothetical protein VLI54_00130 [Bacillota bacterium]|nr:hypothetical protein [Bacillota bacterium]
MVKKQKGFSAVEALLIFFVIALVGFSGWYMWHAKHRTAKQSAAAAQTKTTTRQPAPAIDTQAPKSEEKAAGKIITTGSTSTYQSSAYGFSFEFPADWTLAEDLKDIGRNGREGDITVTSPYGTKVHFGPNQGGKGGDCIDPDTETHTTRYCSTRDITHLEGLASAGAEQAVYFLQASMKASDSAGGKTTYYIDIESRDIQLEEGSVIGAFIYPYDEITLLSGHEALYLTVYVSGPDDSKAGSAAYFSTKQVQEATPVLKSFKLLK